MKVPDALWVKKGATSDPRLNYIHRSLVKQKLHSSSNVICGTHIYNVVLAIHPSNLIGNA